MTIKKNIYQAIKQRFFEAVNNATDEERKESMRVLMLFSPDPDGTNICEVVELNPIPEPPLWDSIFENIAKITYGELKRVPSYVAIFNKINYMSVEKKNFEEPRNEEELDKVLQVSNEGYFMLCLEVNTGDAVSQLYTLEQKAVKSGRKHFSIFNPAEMQGFSPAISLAGLAMHLLIASNNDTIQENPPELDDLPRIQVRYLSVDTDIDKDNLTVHEVGREEVDGEQSDASSNQDDGQSKPFTFDSN